MIEQMAYRIFTYKVDLCSSNWRAVRSHFEGLRYYLRRSISQVGGKTNLKLAERAFVKALAEDDKFAQTHYNLGVIYEQQDSEISAAYSYKAVVRNDPRFTAAYYALATLERDPTKRALLCDKVIALEPSHVDAWAMMGAVQFNVRRNSSLWHRAVEPKAITLALSWRAFCQAEWEGIARRKARDIAGRSLVDLAFVLHQAGLSPRQALGVVRQALRLNPDDSRARYRLATALGDAQQYRRAISAYGEVLRSQVPPSRFARSAALGLAKLIVDLIKKPHSKRDEPEFKKAGAELLTNENATRFLNARLLDELKQLCRDPEDNGTKGNESIEHKRAMKRADLARRYDAKAQELREQEKPTEASRYAEKAQKSFAKSIELFDTIESAGADLYRELAQCFVDDGKSKEARDIFQKAIDQFGGDSRIQASFYRDLADSYVAVNQLHKAQKVYLAATEVLDEQDIADQGFYPQLAEAHLNSGNAAGALEFSQKSVNVAPMDSATRRLLAKTYHALGEYEQAESQWQIALDLEPADWDSLKGIADTYWDRGALLRSPEDRWKAYSRVIEIFENALEFLEDTDAIKWIHFWLGRFHADLRNYDQATRHFNISKNMEYKPLETRVQMGFNYAEAKAYDEAEDSFQEAIDLVTKSKKHATKLWERFDGTEEYPAGDLLALAQIELASTLATRKIRLDRCLELANSAGPLIDKADKWTLEEYPLAASQHECLGLIYLNQDKIDDAVHEFEESIRVRTNGAFDDGGVYFHLARAYMARAKQSRYDAAQWLSRARECCDYARDASVRGVYEEDIAALLRRIDEQDAIDHRKRTRNGRKYRARVFRTMTDAR